MYPSLGKFLVPPGEDWVPGIRYQAEPPLAVKGGLNPWSDERQREVWMVEEKAWAAIRALQSEYNSLMSQMSRAMQQFNDGVASLEALTGKKSGIGTITNYASLGYSLVGGPYAWAAALASFTFGFFSQQAKAKKIKKQVESLERLQAQMVSLKAKIEANIAAVTDQLNKGESIRSAQAGWIVQDVAHSEAAYVKRQDLDRQRASVLQERNRQAALLPRLTPGGYDAL